MEIQRLQKHQLAKTMHVKTWKQEGHPWIIDADVVTIKNVKTVEKEKLQGHSWPIDVVDLTTGKLKTENRNETN